jgi:CheY-like chemotaxis protein
MINNWMKRLFGALEYDAPVSPKGDAEHKSTSNVVSKQDVYHHERNVLLLKSGQTVGDRALESLHRQGVPVMECCAVKQKDGSLKPLEEHVLRSIVARIERANVNRHLAERMSDKLSDGAEDVIPTLNRSTHFRKNTQAWQRHFKVLVVSEDKQVHARMAKYLEGEGVLGQHIRPVFSAESFRYIYNKYAPTCLVLDDNAHYNFVKQGVDVLTLCESFPKDLADIIMVRNENTPSMPPRPSTHFKQHHLSSPVQRAELKQVLTPITNTVKRIYSESTQVNLKLAEEL